MATRRKAVARSSRPNTKFYYAAIGFALGLVVAALLSFLFRGASTPSSQSLSQSPSVQTRPSAAVSPSSNVSGAAPPSSSSPPAMMPQELTPNPTVTSAASTLSATIPTSTTPPPKTSDKTSNPSGDAIGNLIKSMPSDKPTSHLSVPKDIDPTPLKIQAPESVSSSGAGGALAIEKFKPTYVQIGSFRSNEEADTAMARLVLLGYENTSVKPSKVNSLVYYRVQVGPYKSQQALNQAIKTLQKQQFNPVVAP